MAVDISYDWVWVFARKYQEENYPHFLDDLYRQLKAIVPHLPLGDAKYVLKDCPSDNREAMWRLWLRHHPMSHLGLQGLAQDTKGMSSDVLSLVWMQWVSQTDLTQYTPRQLDKVAKELPGPLVRRIVEVYKQQRGIRG